MKIMPISEPMGSVSLNGNPAPSRVDSVRTLKLQTNATPLTGMPQEQLSNLSNNGETLEPEVEATAPLSPQLALLAKQRRALQLQKKELEDREKALLERSGQAGSIEVSRLKSEPLKVLLENGVSYDQLTEAIVADQGDSEVNALKRELQTIKESIKQEFTQRDAEGEKQVLAEMRREADRMVSLDDYELVRETRSVPKVMSLIEKTYRDSGEVLEVSEAMKLVENELLKDAQKMMSFKKLQGQLANTMPAMPQPRPQGMRTLTNRDTANMPASPKARAMAAFYGNLKR